MIEINEKNARKLASAIMDDVAELLVLRAKAQILREEIDEIHRQVLSERDYFMTFPARGDRPERKEKMTERSYAFLLSDEDAAHYFARVEEIVQADPRYDVKPGYCPALIAESAVRDAERALVDKSSQWLGATANDLLCSRNGLDRYRRYVDLLCGLCASL